jgi:hypothetical protein
MHRLGALIEGGLFRRAAERVGLPADAFELRRHRRAAAVAYLADMRGVRSYLSAEAILRETFRSAAVEPMRPRDRRPHPKLRKEFKQYWRAHGFGGSRHRRAAWRAVAHNINGAAEALSAWAEYGKDVKEEGERRMGELLRRADQIEEQLISLRTVQSLAALDVLNYREHIHRLGGYAESEDEVEHLLRWGTTAESGASQPAPAAAGV